MTDCRYGPTPGIFGCDNDPQTCERCEQLVWNRSQHERWHTYHDDDLNPGNDGYPEPSWGMCKK